MNFKKIIALAVCAMMALSSVASATISEDDGWYLQDTEPTKSAISARDVSVTPDVEKIAAADAKTAGIGLGRGSSALNDDNTDFYKITMTVNNIGELYAAYDIASDYGTLWSVKLQNIAISVPGLSAITKSGKLVTSSTFDGKSWQVGGDGIQLTMGTSGNDAYPASGEEGVYENNPEISVDAYYAVNKGATLDVCPTVVVTYAMNVLTAVDATGVGTENVVLGATPTTYTIAFVDEDGTPLDTKTVAAGETPSTSVVPTKEGHTFAGWTPSIVAATGDAIYTATYIEATPADVLPTSFKAYNKGATDNTDVKGNPVRAYTYNYGAAKFNNVTIEDSKYIYKLIAKSGELESDPIAIGTGNIEVQGTMSFMAIIKSASKAITGIVLRAVAK